MKRFMITGDICHAGRIDVEADSLGEALLKAASGEFVVHEEAANVLAFQWDGNEEEVVEEDV